MFYVPESKSFIIFYIINVSYLIHWFPNFIPKIERNKQDLIFFENLYPLYILSIDVSHLTKLTFIPKIMRNKYSILGGK